MAYSDRRIVIGGLAHIPVLIFIANFVKGKFGIKAKEVNEPEVKKEPVKVIEIQGTIVKEEKASALKEISNKLEDIEKNRKFKRTNKEEEKGLTDR